MKIVPICICFVTHLICASLAKIKAAKSQICIIDRANINTREGPVVQGLNKQIISSAEIMHVSADPRRWVQAQIYQSTQSQSAVRYRSLCHSGIAGETTHSLVGLMTKSPQLQCLMDMILRSSSWSNYQILSSLTWRKSLTLQQQHFVTKAQFWCNPVHFTASCSWRAAWIS